MRIVMLYAYLTVSGMLLGSANNIASESCGEYQKITNLDVVASVFWPVSIGIIFTLDTNEFIISCDGGKV